jgi:hypothetical protein
LKLKRENEEDERIRALPPKEREDVRKRRERLSGESISLFLHLYLLDENYLHPERGVVRPNLVNSWMEAGWCRRRRRS